MAVSVNAVYQKVLALANKEQRGYITPQEFNLFADQAQLDIFNSYFKQLNRAQLDPTKTDDYIDNVDLLKEKINVHRVFDSNSLTAIGPAGAYTLPSDAYAIEVIEVSYSGSYDYVLGKSLRNNLIATELSQMDVNSLTHNQYLGASTTGINKLRPIFYRTTDGNIQIEPRADINSVKVSFIKKPTKPKWTYVVINNKALYNSAANDAQDFDLHESEENNLVIRILELSGISLKDYNLNQTALRDKTNTKAQNN